MTFHLMFVHIIFNSLWVAEWPPFWKELPIRFTICSLSISTTRDFSYFPFGFEDGIWVLIAAIICQCILNTIDKYFMKRNLGRGRLTCDLSLYCFCTCL